MKAAIYARYSTDLQDARSIDDQIALCRDYAGREGAEVTATYCDQAKSGASILGRDGLIAMMAAAQERRFDILIVEHSDRIARSMRDLADIHERLTFLGIEIRAVHSGGALSTAMVGLFGLVGQMQREDGAKKVRRGLAGRVREGKSAGGRAYGYTPVPGKPGELAIVAAEAAIVRRIFAEYNAGLRPRAIAGGLNRDGVAAPRGGTWNASTISGSRARGIGILNCELYAGRIVWNKVRMAKNPETGRRVSRVNPRGEWLTTAAPALAIIDPALFDRLARRRDAPISAGANTRPEQHRRPRHLLSGLIRCGQCGGGMAVIGRQRGKLRIGCSRRRESGMCDNGRTYDLGRVEATVIAGLKRNLDDPRLIATYVESYNAERRHLARQAADDRGRLERRLGEIARAMARLVDAIGDGTADKAVIGPKLRALADEKHDLETRLAPAGASNVITLHPGAIARYRGQIEQLHRELADVRATRPFGNHDLVRELIAEIVIDPKATGLELEIRGHLARLIEAPIYPTARLSGGAYGGTVVAEDRYARSPIRAGLIYSLRIAA